jgi:superfamily II DNA or RNA helicase
VLKVNIEIYTLDSLRNLVRSLQAENSDLKGLLNKNSIPYAESHIFDESPVESEEYDPDQGGRIISKYIDRSLAKEFYKYFWGRTDVFAKRAKNGNYYPQCDNRWNDAVCPKQKGEKVYCEDCEHKCWTKINSEIILKHLIGFKEDGSDVIGVYPLLPDQTCRFLVFDFDNHEKGAEADDFANKDDLWHEEVDALRKICEENGIDALIERSRSGRGAHVWIIFDKPIAAVTARNFGFLLLDKGATSINLKSFRYYDRMYPSQDVANTIGNLVALPLQGQALKKGNSAFVDQNWNAYPDQWRNLFNISRITEERVRECITNWSGDLLMQNGTAILTGKDRPKPWNRNDSFIKSDVCGKLHFELADGVYVDALNLSPRLQNQIRCLATFDNPIFYKNARLGYSNYYNFSTVYLGKDIDGYIQVPRGLFEKIRTECDKSGIKYDIQDHREKGHPIRVSFKGNLYTQQELAATQMLAYDNGILSAATAFGKTVVCSYLIARKRVSTLILIESTDLLSQWEEELNKFLVIDEDLPEYSTKTGKVKKRNSVIGILHGARDTLTGIIDIAMIGSLYKKGKFHEKINSYGMVIMDECHHAASNTAQEILKKINAKYVYGVSATPRRTDQLDQIIYMLIGPIRHVFSAAERAEQQGISHYILPRYTRTACFDQSGEIFKAYLAISKNSIRNEMIVADTCRCTASGRTPVILTKFREHAKLLYEILENKADTVFLMYGDNSDKENDEIHKKMKEVPVNKSLILIATGQKIGEGFDFPRLDTLMLATPVSSPELIEQYAGRLNRDYKSKKDVVIYDYIDSNIGVFDRMYMKRLKTYRKIGFSVRFQESSNKQEVNAIYGSENYSEVFEQDMVEADQEIVVSSPRITGNKIERFINIVKERQEAGVKVVVITQDPETLGYDNPDYVHELITEMKTVGINVITTVESTECFAVMDRNLVWHGGVNLLGKADAWDNLIRVQDKKAADELMGIVMKMVE